MGKITPKLRIDGSIPIKRVTYHRKTKNREAHITHALDLGIFYSGDCVLKNINGVMGIRFKNNKEGKDYLWELRLVLASAEDQLNGGINNV